MGWQRQFDDPIETPDKKLRTLREAVATAAEMLTYAAECGTAWMFLAHMATPKAIHRHEVRQFDAIIGKAEAEARSLKETAPARAR